MTLPDDLSFLEYLLGDRNNKYTSPPWLINNFEDNVWLYDFNYKLGPKKLNWDVTLEDGSSLISAANEELLKAFKYWIAVTAYDHYRSIGKIGHNFRLAITLIDYFLHNSNTFELAKYGITCISANDLKSTLDKVASATTSLEGLFNWSDKLTKYILNEIENTDSKLVDEVVSRYPSISTITTHQLDSTRLSIPIDLVPSARAICVLNNFTESRVQRTPIGPGRSGLFITRTAAISKTFYPNTLLLKSTRKPIDNILSFSVDHIDLQRELFSTPIRTNFRHDRLASSNHFNDHRSTLYKLGELHTLEISAPAPDEIGAIANYTPDLSHDGRYTTVPSSIVFGAVRNAIEFHIEYGSQLLSSYINIVRHTIEQGVTLRMISDELLESLISPSLRALGVKKLTIQRRFKTNEETLDARKNYFTYLRKNVGLLELIAVYYGAIQITVGVLMARRVGELLDLVADDCLDSSNTWLLFKNRKSTRNLMGVQNQEARPIEPIAVEMINEIVNFQSKLIELGAITEYTYLFSRPSLKGNIALIAPGSVSVISATDLFNDYFETPTDSNGRRYYFRQHQLRRFFALLFFHSSTIGGIETLQWMLGHTDMSHVWHYITEATGGEVLRSAKAQYIAESIHKYGADNYRDLSEILKARFGTDDFSIVDSSDLEDYLNTMLESGEIEIEPEFFYDENGQKMKVVVKVMGT